MRNETMNDKQPAAVVGRLQRLAMWLDELTTVTACDCCGKVNPPVTSSGNRRVTLCCINEGGFYAVPEAPDGHGSSGKLISRPLQFPFEFKWKGFRGYGRRR